MKKYLLIIPLFTIFSLLNTVSAQISQGGTPPSFQVRGTGIDIPLLELSKPDMQKIAQEDALDEKNGEFFKVGRAVYCNINPEKDGKWTEIPGKGKIWTIHIHIPDALALGLYYNDFHLPRGGELFIYSPDRKKVLGAYTEVNNHNSGYFANEMISGDELIIEYFEPSYTLGTLSLNINEIAYFYRSIPEAAGKGFGDSDYCQVNINCSEGSSWQDEKRGVARISVKSGPYYGWCSGSLVNNTAQDCTPYFLTADHCADGASSSDLNQWIFYFNYEANGCSNPSSSPSYNSITGGTFKARGPDAGGSDFYLVELNNAPPSSYNVYFNGWSRSSSASTGGVSIHHPSGDIKKISTYTSSLTTASWSGAMSAAHWRVQWSQTTNGHGVTEGGSSGSPIFNNSGRIVGTLTGGGSYCNATSQPDYYGKMDKHWDDNGSANNRRLDHWLDPLNSNPVTLNGFYCGGGSTLSSNFSASATTVPIGTTVNFYDQSSGNPTGWSWSFPGGNPGSSSQQNPSVTYNTAGTYNVTLTVNAGGSTDTEVKNGYITVTSGGTVVCDTATNLYANDNFGYDQLSQNWGYWSGHNGYGDSEYMDKFSGVSQPEIHGLYIGVAKAYDASPASNVRLKIRASGSTPGSVLGYVDAPISSFNPGYWNYVQFSSPITTSGDFYAGFELFYAGAQDTFVCYHATNRGSGSTSTAWVLEQGTSWTAFSDYNFYTSLAIFAVACPISTELDDMAIDPAINVFPNPASGSFKLGLGNDNSPYYIVQIFNDMGVLVKELKVTDIKDRLHEINMENQSAGLYFVSIQTAQSTITKKLILTH